MNNAPFVSGTEPLCNLRGDLDGLTLRKWPGSQPLAKSLAFQKLCDDERQSVMCSDVEDGQDIGMMDLSRRACLALEACAAVGITGKIRRKNFQSDVARETGITRPVDFPHSACPQWCKNFIGAKACPWSYRHRRRDYSPRRSVRAFSGSNGVCMAEITVPFLCRQRRGA